MDIYTAWKFKKDPFETSALPSDDVGNDLIVGRDIDIERFLKRLYNGTRIVTIEGDVGIGKTSIINVGVYRATMQYFTNKNIKNFDEPNPLFFGCLNNFQMEEGTDTDRFREKVFRSIAQTIIQYKDTFKNLKIALPPNIDEVDNWLHNPQSSDYSGSLGFLSMQVGGSKSSRLNETSGFEQSGIELLVRNWLKQIFKDENGGIVCVIDNLELLKNSASARKVIENLRDTLFTIKGIKWVFCGSFGIVSSILASPRLEGFLHDPISVKGISPNYIKALFDKRIEKYKKNDNSYLPITHTSFSILYDILNQNIRSTLRYAGEYCFWVSDGYKHPIKDQDKDEVFLEWLIQKSSKYKKDVEGAINIKSLELFTKFLNEDRKDEEISLRDFEKFDYPCTNTFKAAIKELEKISVVTTVADKNDTRKKSIEILPKGYFISYALQLKGKK